MMDTQSMNIQNNEDLFKILKELLQLEDRARIFWDKTGFDLSCIQIRWKSEDGSSIQSTVFLGTNNMGASFRLTCACNGRNICKPRIFYNITDLLKAIKKFKQHTCQINS